jgi:glycosyltransferase involved in cell wall biosynthesis
MRAIDSVLAQKLPPSEVVVVDDGSTDTTPRILAAFGRRINVIRQGSRGPSAARNVGAAAAGRANYLAFLDADDVWLPEMLQVMVEQLEQVPARVLAFCDVEPIDERGYAVTEPIVPEECAHAPEMNELLMRWWPILPSAAVMRRSAFDSCGGFSEDFTAPGFEDPYLWMLMRELGEFAYLPERLVLYRTSSPVERMEKYEAGYQTFSRLVRRRYGAAGEQLVREITTGFGSAWDHEGLIALKVGNKKEARRDFARALRYNRLHVRSHLRWLRTFLPLGVAQALSGGFVHGTKVSAEHRSTSWLDGE